MKLNELAFDHLTSLMRERLALYAPHHAQLDYEKLFSSCRQRALRIWNTHIVPELDINQQRDFERALVKVGMRAGIAIPWVFASGYAFGLACHDAAGGDAANRESAAAICGLYMFFMGTYDHLLDEYPEEFSELDKIINADSLKRWAIDRDLRELTCDPNKILASGLAALYRAYFKLCHRMLDRHPDSGIAQMWLEALYDTHRVEAESVDRRISKVNPSQELIKHTEAPSIAAFWALAVSACLADGAAAAKRIEIFSKDYGRLTWYADDVSDIEKDIQDDRWSGLAIKLSLEAENNKDAERVIAKTADAAGAIITALYEKSGNKCWEPQDSFSLADILWAYIWAWLGGPASVDTKRYVAKLPVNNSVEISA